MATERTSRMTDDQQQPDPDDGQSFQFQLRDMLLVTFVAALFFGLLGSAPAGFSWPRLVRCLVKPGFSCGGEAGRLSGTRDHVDMLKFAVSTFLLECLLGWTTGYTFEKLDSNGNWGLRWWWSKPSEYRTVATINEGEYR